MGRYRRRKWTAAALGVAILVVAGSLWRFSTGSSEEERVFVGRWAESDPPNPQHAGTFVVEFGADRTYRYWVVFADGSQTPPIPGNRWSVAGGVLRLDPPPAQPRGVDDRLSDWIRPGNRTIRHSIEAASADGLRLVNERSPVVWTPVPTEPAPATP